MYGSVQNYQLRAMCSPLIKDANHMKTYKAVDQHGNTVIVSAYTESEARQKAEEQLGYGNVIAFTEV